MHFRPSSGGKHIFGVFRAHRTCLVAANEGINSALPNPLAGFEANFAAKEGKKKNGKTGKGKEGKTRKRRKNPLPFPPINFWLRPCAVSSTSADAADAVITQTET